MAERENTTRWWENYLVRYFMPSIAGMAIVSWLSKFGGNDFKRDLFFGFQDKDPTALIMLVLYGNLFCYIASYPILCFHATRVIDFKCSKWRVGWLDGYLWSLAAAIAVIAVATTLPKYAVFLALIIAGVFTFIQMYRIVAASTRGHAEDLREEASLAYRYAFWLAQRRGVVEERIDQRSGVRDEDQAAKKKRETERRRELKWRSELVDTYRHLREHGNSAFIFLLELVLAGLCYIVFSEGAEQKMLWLSILLGIWAFPAMWTHFIGQHLERRFSTFDRRIPPNYVPKEGK